MGSGRRLMNWGAPLVNTMRLVVGVDGEGVVSLGKFGFATRVTGLVTGKAGFPHEPPGAAWVGAGERLIARVDAEVCLKIKAFGKLFGARGERAVVERLTIGVRGRDSARGSVLISRFEGHGRRGVCDSHRSVHDGEQGLDGELEMARWSTWYGFGWCGCRGYMRGAVWGEHRQCTPGEALWEGGWLGILHTGIRIRLTG